MRYEEIKKLNEIEKQFKLEKAIKGIEKAGQDIANKNLKLTKLIEKGDFRNVRDVQKAK